MTGFNEVKELSEIPQETQRQEIPAGFFNIENIKDNDIGDQLDSILENFLEEKWNDMPLEEKKEKMLDLADFVAVETGNDNPPEIVFRTDMADNDFASCLYKINLVEINENLIKNPAEAVNTVAHEMWHAYQYKESLDPNSERGREYKEGFENYTPYEYDIEGYYSQMIEVEAREYAKGFEDRLAGLKGENV